MPDTPRGRPDDAEYAAFYAGYIAAVPDGDILASLREGGDELATLLASVPEARAGFRYARDKWTVREVVGHVIDAERIFAYRALRIARGDATPLAGFDENAYARAAGSDARTMADLAGEVAVVRDGTLRLFESMPEDAWLLRGIANGQPITVRALAYILAGHARHHARVLRERYLAEPTPVTIR